MKSGTSSDFLLEVENLKKYFAVRKGILSRQTGWVRAVNDVSFKVRPGETLGLVGESGCGKTTVGRTLLRLIEPTSGSVVFQGKNLARLSKKELRTVRQHISIISQDPFASLNPRMTIGAIVGEGLIIHKIGMSKDRIKLVKETLEKCGLSSSYINRYPHEFSGGQRQRIGIARALILSPKFIVCDEPVSALDVSIQAQVINLLVDLKKRSGIAYLFISHDLSVVKYISDRVAIMYLGKIIELGESRELYRNPLHPYTKSLLSAVPIPDPTRSRNRIILEGDVPSPLSPPQGCHFHPRCPEAVRGLCDIHAPRTVSIEGHEVACHVVEDQLRQAGKRVQVISDGSSSK